MNSSLSQGSSIAPLTGVDLSAAIGKLVTFTAGVPAVNASATVPAVGVVLEGNTATRNSSIGIMGGITGTFLGLISATSAALSFGDTVQQAADGTLTKDLGAGNARVVVGVVGDLNGAVAGDLCDIAFFTPQIRS